MYCVLSTEFSFLLLYCCTDCRVHLRRVVWVQMCDCGHLWNLPLVLGQGLLGGLVSGPFSHTPSLLDHDKEGRLGGSSCRRHIEGSKRNTAAQQER